jgi:hypothetical protein
MNPGGPVEEIGSTVRSVVHVLESQPMALAMILSNFLLLGYLWYAAIENNRQRAELGRLIFKEHSETRDLLAKCIIPDKTRGGGGEPSPRWIGDKPPPVDEPPKPAAPSSPSE